MPIIRHLHVQINTLAILSFTYPRRPLQVQFVGVFFDLVGSSQKRSLRPVSAVRICGCDWGGVGWVSSLLTNPEHHFPKSAVDCRLRTDRLDKSAAVCRLRTAGHASGSGARCRTQRSCCPRCRRRTGGRREKETRACARVALIAVMHSRTIDASFSADSPRAEANAARPRIHVSTSSCRGRSGCAVIFRDRPLALRKCWRGDALPKRDAGISAPNAKKSGGASGSWPTPSPIRNCSPNLAKIDRSSSICWEDKPSDCKPDVSAGDGSRAAGSMSGRRASHNLAM
jgi:hypothetical protein